MPTGPELNVQYAKAFRQFREEKNQYVHCALGEKSAFSPNVITRSNGISCSFSSGFIVANL